MMTVVLFVMFVAKNFDKHQKICMVGSKRQAETDPQCSTSLAHHSKPNPVDKTKDSLPSKTEMGLQMLYPRNHYLQNHLNRKHLNEAVVSNRAPYVRNYLPALLT